MDKHHFFKEIQCGQSICVNFIVDLCKGLGSDFSFVLCFPSVFFLYMSLSSSCCILLPGEGPSPQKEFRVSPGMGHEDKGGLWANSPTRFGTAGLLGGMVLASHPWASYRTTGEEPPGRGRPGLGQENSRKET
jgi:hypothetical protein